MSLTEGWTENQGEFSNEEGVTIKREYGKTPNGNELGGSWVYRVKGEFVDYDQYFIDLCNRYGLKPKSWI